MTNKPDSNILYHYTNNAGLVDILSTGELWFSDIRFLNDAQETHRAIEIGDYTIGEASKKHRDIWLNAGCLPEQFDYMVENLRSHMRRNSHHYETVLPSIPFVFSMSERHDALSQWRAYGNTQYCIGFDAEKLEKKFGAQLIEVKYPDEPITEESVEAALDHFFTVHLVHIDRHNGSIDTDVLMNGAGEFFSPYRLYNVAFLSI